MTTVEKKLAPTQRRYEARAVIVGKKQVWRIYDRQRGSWPIKTPWTGEVPEEMTEAQAKALADDLEAGR